GPILPSSSTAHVVPAVTVWYERDRPYGCAILAWRVRQPHVNPRDLSPTIDPARRRSPGSTRPSVTAAEGPLFGGCARRCVEAGELETRILQRLKIGVRPRP